MQSQKWSAPSQTELRILAWLAEGRNCREIATRLRCSDQAARRRAMELRRRLGAKSLANLVFVAVQRGFLRVDDKR